jgi:hypothetical protein
MIGPVSNEHASQVRAAALGTDVDAVISAVSEYVKVGYAIQTLANLLAGTEWRYEIAGSGTSIIVQSRRQLMSVYEELLEQVREAAADVIEADGTRKFRLHSLEKREELGRYCHTLLVESGRVHRYLYPHEPGPDAKQDIEQSLAGTHLQWDGRFEVERFPGENALLLRLAQS